MNSSPAHTQPAVPAADSVSGTPDAPARTGYVPGPDTLRAETAFAGTNFAYPGLCGRQFRAVLRCSDRCSPFRMARHDLRRNFRSAVDPRGTRTHSARTASAARGKRRFPGFRAAARRHLRHAALPQPGATCARCWARISRDAATGNASPRTRAEAATRVS